MREVKTIIHIVISLETGGLEKFVLDLIKATNDDINHKVICLERIGELASSSGLENVVCLGIKPGLHWSAIMDICTIVRNANADLIHTHNEKAQFYGALSGMFCRIPVVHTKHGKNQTNFKSLFKNNLLSYLCTRVVAVSRDAALQCAVQEKIPASKVMTILNGVDTDAFKSKIDKSTLKVSLGIGYGVPVIGIVARLAVIKDHASLFAACKILKDTCSDFKLLVVGDGPTKTDLFALSQTLGLNSTIIFTGTRCDIPDLMNAMDVFVLSSISEGISLTLIEAMSCELPVVATDVGGNSEVVVDGETGFLVPLQSPSLMAERIQQLLNNVELRKDFGKKGRLRAVEYFSIKRAARQYEELYHSILSEH